MARGDNQKRLIPAEDHPLLICRYLILRESMDAIAETYGAVRERVRQLLKKYGVSVDSLPPCPCGKRRITKVPCADCQRREASTITSNAGLPCSCGRPARIKGRCNRCYTNDRYRDDPEFRERRLASAKRWRDRQPKKGKTLLTWRGVQCLDCEAPAKVKQRCNKHHQQWLKHNVPGYAEKVRQYQRDYYQGTKAFMAKLKERKSNADSVAGRVAK